MKPIANRPTNRNLYEIITLNKRNKTWRHAETNQTTFTFSKEINKTKKTQHVFSPPPQIYTMNIYKYNSSFPQFPISPSRPKEEVGTAPGGSDPGAPSDAQQRGALGWSLWLRLNFVVWTFLKKLIDKRRNPQCCLFCYFCYFLMMFFPLPKNFFFRGMRCCLVCLSKSFEKMDESKGFIFFFSRTAPRQGSRWLRRWFVEEQQSSSSLAFQVFGDQPLLKILLSPVKESVKPLLPVGFGWFWCYSPFWSNQFVAMKPCSLNAHCIHNTSLNPPKNTPPRPMYRFETWMNRLEFQNLEGVHLHLLRIFRI